MKASIRLIWAVFLAAGLLSAEDSLRHEANVLLLKASDLSSFKSGERPQLNMQVQFVVRQANNADAKGTYLQESASAEKWRYEILFGGFHEIRVRLEKRIWTKKNTDFVPLPVETLSRALFTTRFLMVQSDVVKRLQNRKVNGVEARCIDFENIVGSKKENGQICIERATGVVIYWQYGQREIWYSNYLPFAGKLLPRHITAAQGAFYSLEADVIYNEVKSFPSDAFTPLVDAEITDVCTNSRPPILKHAPDPVYPPSLRRGAFKGKMVVEVEIGEDGHVKKEAIVQTVHPDLDRAVLIAVRQWIYEPKTCDGKPVPSVTKVEFDYR